MIRGFAVAAPHSGAGKTTVALGLMAALRARGLIVQPFKVGPDYIDPAHHHRITGRPSHNLDTWMLSPDVNREIFTRAAAGADVAVVEGVMGLFDGVDGHRPHGSTAHLAALLGLPVVLVVDARSMARSAAAVVHGFATFDPAVTVAGVIWNRVGSPNHRRILDEALESAGLPPSLGGLPRRPDLALRERHLGLVTPDEDGLDPGLADRLAGWVADHVDLDALLARAAIVRLPPPDDARPRAAASRRVAVARDTAFCFYYEENLRVLAAADADLVYFRPVDGDGVPPGVDGLYLGGGYPELHAARLSANRAFLDGVRSLHERGAPILAECGGFMALCRGLADPDGRFHEMAGIFPTAARMNASRFRLGYREVEVAGVDGLDGLRARGHEFHYSHVDPVPDRIARAFRVRSARGDDLPDEGYRVGRTLAGYVHLHFASCPSLPRRWFGLDDPTGDQVVPAAGR